uniref:Uncharacterized protein n=1 Tax=Arundo donax TaxID=35708 RepID=A0A0A9HT43_ARUDO
MTSNFCILGSCCKKRPCLQEGSKESKGIKILCFMGIPLRSKLSMM